ncbi:hypothetical protein [Roseofilum casamattae]|uniref:Uncharacterized protein n=1 Tax=Roseofilum casamattae BLCC-M143 TaxID=3022442 RepID=A0ABT7BU45_9CYAN|nr:hypothetical protein [Roseofilum casamattae]MDJ1182709.1 hypothetical protein [Roseofilum casamattae BLCC-M143]
MPAFKHPKRKTQRNVTSSQTYGPKAIRSVQRQVSPGNDRGKARSPLNPQSNHFSLYGSGQPMTLQRDLQNPEANVNWSLHNSPSRLHRSMEGGREHSHPELMLSHRKPSQRKTMEQLQRSLLPKRGDGKPRRVRGTNNMMQLKAIAKLPYDSLQPARAGEVLQRDKDLALPDTSTPGEANIDLDKDDVNVVANDNFDQQQEGVPQNVPQDAKDEDEGFPIEGEQETTTTIDDDESEDEWDDETPQTPMGSDNVNAPDPSNNTPMGVDNADSVNNAPMGNGLAQNNVPIISPGGPNSGMPQPRSGQKAFLEFGNFYGSGTSDPITLEQLYQGSLRKLIKSKFNRSIAIYKSSKEIRIVDRNPRPKNHEQTKNHLAKQTNSFYQDVKRRGKYKFAQKYIKYKTKVKPSHIVSRQTGVGINNQTNETEPLYHYETSIKLGMPLARKWRKGWKEFFKGGYQSTVGANQSDAIAVAQEGMTGQDGYTIYDRISTIVDIVKGKGADIPNRVSGLISGNSDFWTWAFPSFGIATLIKNFLDIEKYWRRRKKLQQSLADSEAELANGNIDSKKRSRLVKLQEGIKYGMQKLKTLCWTVFVNAFATFIQVAGRILTLLIPAVAVGTIFTDVLATVTKLASFAVRKLKGLKKHFQGTRGKQRLVSAKAMFDSAVAGDAVGISAIRALDTKSFVDVFLGHAQAGAKKLGKGIGTTVAATPSAILATPSALSRLWQKIKGENPLDRGLKEYDRERMQEGKWPNQYSQMQKMLHNVNDNSEVKETFLRILGDNNCFEQALAGDYNALHRIKSLSTTPFIEALGDRVWSGTKQIRKVREVTTHLNKPLDDKLSDKGKDQLQWGRWPTDDADFAQMLKNIKKTPQRQDDFMQTLADRIKSSV